MIITLLYLLGFKPKQVIVISGGFIAVVAMTITFLLGIHVTMNYSNTVSVVRADIVRNMDPRHILDHVKKEYFAMAKKGDDYPDYGSSIIDSAGGLVDTADYKEKDIELYTELERKGTSCGNQSNGIPDTSYLYGKCIAGRHHILMYNRVPKCGSRTLLSLTEILAERYGYRKPAEIIISREKWQRLKREVPYYEIVRKRLRNTPVTSVLHGHIYFLDYSREKLLLPHKRPLYLNLIRDPFDRMVSQYYFVRFGDGKFTNLKQLHRMTHPKFINESFNECVERDRPECIGPYGQSLLVKYFCGYSPHCQDPTEEALETAKQNLDKYVVVGVAEEYEDFLKVLEKLLPDYYHGILTEFKTSTEKRNEKKMKAKKKKPVKPEVEERVKALLELDYKFYNHTRERFHELKKSLGID